MPVRLVAKELGVLRLDVRKRVNLTEMLAAGGDVPDNRLLRWVIIDGQSASSAPNTKFLRAIPVGWSGYTRSARSTTAANWRTRALERANHCCNAVKCGFELDRRRIVDAVRCASRNWFDS